MQARLDDPKLTVSGVDHDVVVEPGDHAGGDEDEASFLVEPLLAEIPAHRRRQAFPPRQARRRKGLVGEASGDGDLNAMLVRRQAPAATNQLFQQRRRIMLARIDERASRRIPPPRSQGRAPTEPLLKKFKLLFPPQVLARGNQVKRHNQQRSLRCQKLNSTSKEHAPTGLAMFLFSLPLRSVAQSRRQEHAPAVNSAFS